MDYATTDNRAATPTRKQKAKTAAQKLRAVPAEPRAQERQRRRTFRPPAICPAGAAACGFLKTRFLPHYTGQALAGSSREKERFYSNFSLLCNHYKINPVATENLYYPYCREVALYEAARLLRESHPQQVTIELKEVNGDFALNITEHFNTQNTLFYIPVEPLHFMMKSNKGKKAARLLLCVFSYLYHVVGLPYYTEDSGYLYWNYEMLAEWVTDDPDGWDAEDYYSYVGEIRSAQHIGETMLRRLWNAIHLERFGEWVADYKPNDTLGQECHCLAKKFHALWRDFPAAHIYSHADESCLPDPEEGYDDNDCITMEKYISFVASTKGWLYNNLEQSINNDFNECQSMQEPVLKRRFDGQPQQDDTLDFECRLFPLINELCYLLNNCDYEN
jgi:hypothetical protein